MNFKRHVAFYCLFVFAFGGLPAGAQVDTGAILGSVKDQSGGAVPGVKVTLTNEGTGVSVSTETHADGSYLFTPPYRCL